MAGRLAGAPVAAAITENLAERAKALQEKGIVPTLAIVRVGENESDLAYERGALKRCEKAEIKAQQIVLPADVTREEMLAVIDRINEDEKIHGCLMFRPLPKTLNEAEICERLAVKKDVDSMTSGSLVSVFSGRGEGFAPCTAQSCLEILDYYGVELTGKRVTVIGRSLVIGKPVSMLLQSRNATVTMCHTKTKDLAKTCAQAEILVAAAGRAGVVTPEFTNPEQVILDVGINVNAEGKLCGDVDYEAVEPLTAALTPVPGGVGAVTTAVLCKHVIEAAEKAAQAR